MRMQVLDFPKQRAISRDNAIIELDAVLNFKVRPALFARFVAIAFLAAS